MSKFDERYDIRLAYASDIDNIMHFVDKYWRKGHIMARDRELFKYEYADGNNVNFVLAIDKNTQLIEGIFGFIKCSHTNDAKKKDIWGSMWMVNSEHENIPFLGIELAKRVFVLTECRTQIGNGANPRTTVPLRKIFFGDKTVKMKQYYLLNTSVENYKIAVIHNQPIADKPFTFEHNETFLKQFHSIDEIKSRFSIEDVDAIPYKDSWYVNKRYFCHPYYKYNVYGLADSTEKIGALMMARVVKYNGRKVIRIVDYIGDHKLFAGLHKEFQNLIKANDFEYIDFYTYGFDEQSILKAGFKLRTDDDPNIIPNYFEPFVQENIDIWAHYQLNGTLFFKADGDQDRPNRVV